MSGGKKRILYIVAGILGGILSFSGIELLFQLQAPGYLVFTLLQGAVVGASLGLVLGLVDDIAYSRLKLGLVRGGAAALVTSMVSAGVMLLAAQLFILFSGAADSLRFGASVADAAGGSLLNSPGFISMLSRSIGWLLIGVAAGGVSGFRRGSSRRLTAGLLGGALGGLAGGIVLELLLRVTDRGLSPLLARLMGFVILGGFLGFSLGEFERRFSFARLRILTGVNKNREYLISGRETHMGAHINSGVYLGDYPDINQKHARIQRAGEDMILKTDAGDVKINDEDVSERALLKYQDVIRIGSVKLLLLQP